MAGTYLTNPHTSTPPMKNILTASLILATLAFFQADAEAKKYGGLKKGDSFTMKVKSVTSTSQVGYSGAEVPAGIHPSAVSLKKGKVVKFKIRSRGLLTAKGGLRAPFAHAQKKLVEFNDFVDGTVTVTHNVELVMKKNKPVSATISVFITDNSGAEPVFYTTIYKLK